MRFKWLEIQNLTSLKGSHLIDFEALSDENLFSIVGPTGSGKSTVLNAISLALYGELYKKNLGQTDLITLGQAKAKIKIAFAVNGQEYLSIWSSRTLKKDGTPLKKPITVRELFQYIEGEKTLCQQTIEDIIGLDFNQFTKTTILNQGEFSRFLTSTFSERKDILEKLCHLEVLKDLSKLLAQDLNLIENQKNQKESELKAYKESYIPMGPLEEDLALVTKEHSKLCEIIKEQKNLVENIKQTNKIVADFKIKNQDLENTQNEKSTFLKEYEIIEEEVHIINKDFVEAKENLKQNRPPLTLAIRNQTKLIEVEKNINVKQDNQSNITKELENLNESLTTIAKEQAQTKRELTQLNKKRKSTWDKDEIKKHIEAYNQKVILQNERDQLENRKANILNFYFQQTQKIISEIALLNTELNTFLSLNFSLERVQHKIFNAHYQKLDMDYALSISSLINSIHQKKHDIKNCPICDHQLDQQDLKNIMAKTSNVHNRFLKIYQESLQEKSKLEQELSYKLNAIKLRLNNISPLETEEFLQLSDRIKQITQENLLNYTNELGLKSLQNELELISQAQNLEQKLNYLNQKTNDIKTRIQKQNDQLIILTKTIKEDQSCYLDLKRKLEPFAGNDPQKTLNQLQNYYDQLEEKNNDISEKFKNATQKLNSLNDKIEYLSSQLVDYNMTFNHLKKSLPNLKLPEKISEVNIEILNHAFELAEKKLDEQNALLQEKNQTIGTLRQKITTQKTLLEKIELITKEIQNITKELGPKLELNQLISRDEFRNYVLKRVEENLVNQANIELKNLCDGRYRIILHSSKSKINDFFIQDLFLSSAERKISTLSGGETFMASLAMAMALSELSRGTTEIDAFFIDEGFATLDDDSLDDVMNLLEKIKSRGKQVGVISHVEKLKSRISSSLVLNKQHDGYSSLTQI